MYLIITSHLTLRGGGVQTPTLMVTSLNSAAIRRQEMYRFLEPLPIAIHKTQFSKVLTQQI